MFTIQWPWAILLLPIPLLVRAFVPGRAREAAPRLPELRFSHLNSLREAYGGSSPASLRRGIPWLLLCLWALLVLALIRPQLVDHLSSAKSEGHDIMLAVDLSGSMQSFDFSTGTEYVSRLDVAKKAVQDFVRKRAGDRVGLVVFGEHAYLQSPLTFDRMAVSQMLDSTVPGVAGDATAIGDAIGIAVRNLRDRNNPSRAIVLLTDGEDNASTLPPLQAAKLAKEYGIRIYTIVIGRDGEVPFPDGHGGVEMVESHVDTDLTRKLAELTGGEYFRSTDPASLARIYDQIDTLQKSEAEPPPVLIRSPLYPYPLALALVLLGAWGIEPYFGRRPYESLGV